MHSLKTLAYLCLCASLAPALACGGDDDGGPDENEPEVITTVGLTFTPMGGGTPMTFEFDDPDGDGGDPPVIDPIELAAGTFTVAVSFENRLEDPPEDITEEVADESDEHQVFFTGSGVDGPASDSAGAPLTHDYDDEDANGLPVGLENTMTAAAGTGDLTVTLRHLPPINDVAVKVSGLAAQVRDGGFSSIGGSTDAQVTFAVTIE
jgi:hypothetical protein